MKKLQPTTQYKKDYKKYRNNPKKVEALKEVLKMLMNEQPGMSYRRRFPSDMD